MILRVLPLLLVACLALPAATVTLLDGQTRTGDALSITASVLSLDGTAIPLAEVDWFALAEPTALTPLGEDQRMVVFTDGGAMPLTAVASTVKDMVDLTCGELHLQLPLMQLSAWGTPADLTARPTEQDQAFLDTGVLQGDLMGIRDGQVLLQTRLQDEPVKLPIATVRSLRLAGPPQSPTTLHFTASLLQGQAPALLAPVWPPRLQVAPEVALAANDGRLPGGSAPVVPRVVVRGNRRVYLSDLEPTTVIEEGAFGVVWPHARNTSIDGGPCFLADRRYDKCLVVHSKATVTWQLDGGYVRFSALLGIDDAFAKVGDCAVSIQGDGKDLWSQESVTGKIPPIPVVLDNLAGITTLRLVVDYGARQDIGDHLVLADAWLLKRAD